jgi:phosphatidate cytidylyltransferase
MKRVLTAVVLVPFVLLLVFRAPLWLFALAVAGLIVLALREYLNLAEGYGIQPVGWLTYVVTLLVLLQGSNGTIMLPDGHLWRKLMESNVLILVPLIFAISIVFRRDMKMAMAASSVSAFAVFYIGQSLSNLLWIRAIPHERGLIVFILFSVWAGDIAAYYVGKNFGRHKLAPVVSPNKSWEGAVASIVASLGVAFLVFHNYTAINALFGPDNQGGTVTITVFDIFMYGIITNIAAQFGDLFESALKRGAGVKDSGNLLPGHGGILDRIDALLFAIPAACFYAMIARNFY